MANGSNRYLNSMSKAEFKRVLIERIQVSIGAIMPRHILDKAELVSDLYELCGDMSWQLRLFMAGKEHSERVPADWWQHVKLRFAPKWWLVKYPVEYRKIVITHFCPHLHLPDNNSKHITFLLREDKHNDPEHKE